jgi:hypothetical protein
MARLEALLAALSAWVRHGWAQPPAAQELHQETQQHRTKFKI